MSASIFLNTIVLYSQRVLSALLAFVTTPIVLRELGVADYGIYTVTLGVVAILGFLNWSLSSATFRYIGFAIGKGDRFSVEKAFVSAWFLHGLYAISVTLGILLFRTQIVETWLNIPPDKIETAKALVVYAAIITSLGILTVPFTGFFRANENFAIQGALGVCESLLKLIATVILIKISHSKLLVYGQMLVFIASSIFIFYVIIGYRKYKLPIFSLSVIDNRLLGEIFSFLSWSILGALAIVGRNQGISVVLNRFFTVTINAAYGVSLQVNSAIGILSQGIIGAISPRIVKSAGSGTMDKIVPLMNQISKFSSIAVCLIIVPFSLETEFILHKWLAEVPPYTADFCRLVALLALVTTFSAGVNTCFDAIGRVKAYNIVVSLILLLNIPISIWLFSMHLPPYLIIVVSIVLELISFIARLVLLSRYLQFSVVGKLRDIFLRILVPVFVACLVLMPIVWLVSPSFLRLSAVCIVFLPVYSACIYFFSLDKDERSAIVKIALAVSIRTKK